MTTSPPYRYDAHRADPASAMAPGAATLPVEVRDRLSRVLGQAVVRCWSRLPRDIQHDVFEAAVNAEGEEVRQSLAVYLHGAHARTIISLQSRAMPEPDSLGG